MMSIRNQPKIYEANRRPKGCHPLFCFISFIGIYYLCDRTPGLEGPTVRQEATCVAAASGPCPRLRGLKSLLLNELVYENTRVFHTIGTLERINSACLEDVEGNMRSHIPPVL
jgi:hypothetical protein